MTSYHLSNRSSIVSALSELVAFKSRIVVEYQRVVRVGRFQVTDCRRVPVLPVQVAIQFKEVDKASGVGRVAREDRVFVHVLRVARFVPAGGAGGAGERRSGRVGE